MVKIATIAGSDATMNRDNKWAHGVFSKELFYGN
jgi:hypothetical protein